MTVDMKILVLLIKVELLVLLIVSFEICAKDFGTFGKTYKIEEIDMREEIKKKMSENKEDLHKKLEWSFSNYIRKTKGIELPKCSRTVEKRVSLSVQLSSDIKDNTGKILYPKGTQLNPLQYRRLSKKICFFDGDNLNQVKFILNECFNPSDKLILTKGNFFDVSQKYNKKRFYFDQNSILVNKFQIDSLPAIVEQRGEDLYVKQVAIP